MGGLLIAVVTGAVVLLMVLVDRLLPKHDPREPPKHSTGLPIIGNLIGMGRHGHRYYRMVGGENPPPIFTMDILLTKSYVITSPKMSQAVQRNSKSIGFEPLLDTVAVRICGISPHGLKLLTAKEEGGHGVNSLIIHSMGPSLQGAGLDRMNHSMVGYVKTINEQLAKETGPFDLFGWCRHAITIASTDAVYGPKNPYHDPEIEQAFWDWEVNLGPLMANILPSITARRQLQGRDKVVKAIMNYRARGGIETASELTKVRAAAMKEGNLEGEDAARAEAALAFGLLTNSVPGTFFMLFDICSRPELTAELREELQTNAVRIEERNGTKYHVLDLGRINEGCHHYLSTFQEMLRLRMLSASTRQVIKDVMIDDQYLLKKGNIVQTPAEYFNVSTEIWGANAREFDSKRFLVRDANSRRTKGFIAFGTTPNICPGRHFAVAEIMALAAMILLNFDIEPVGGEWKDPVLSSSALTASIFPPKDPFIVTVKRREEFKDAVWDVTSTDGKGKFNLIVG